MSETINIPRDTTMQLLVKVHRDQIAGEMDLKYKEKVAAATSKAEVDALFTEWWKIQYNPELFTKAEMLERWFGNVLVDSRVHGVTTPRYDKSTSMIGTLTDDSTGLTCTPSTESTAGNDPFALGRDGSRYSPTSGKEPGMIQGVEFMNGSYLIVSDELWQWSTDADGNYNFDCFKCYDQSKVGSSVNENYDQIKGAHLVYPAGTGGAWTYITDNIIDDDVLWPEATTASGSGVGVGAGFYRYPAASGVRAAWCFGSLYDGGYGGVPCRSSSFGVSYAYWYGSLGAPGLEG